VVTRLSIERLEEKDENLLLHNKKHTRKWLEAKKSKDEARAAVEFAHLSRLHKARAIFLSHYFERLGNNWHESKYSPVSSWGPDYQHGEGEKYASCADSTIVKGGDQIWLWMGGELRSFTIDEDADLSKGPYHGTVVFGSRHNAILWAMEQARVAYRKRIASLKTMLEESDE
jgi:hypothetical protein